MVISEMFKSIFNVLGTVFQGGQITRYITNIYIGQHKLHCGRF